MRFFTVYGPFGRPDMALFKFTKSILKNKRNNLSDHRSGLELLKKIYKLNKINF